MFSRRFKTSLSLLSCLILGASFAHGQTPTVPDGDEIQVNTYTSGNQTGPAVTVLTTGDFIVVWNGSEADNGDPDDSAQGQRYDSAGNPLGDQFLINTYTTGDQITRAIAAGLDGTFIVAWSSNGSYGDDSDDRSVQAQRFDSSGAPVAAQFQVNTYTTDYQDRPSIAIAPSGDFVIVWNSSDADNGDSNDMSIQGQLYSSDGSPAGDQFLVNTYTTDAQRLPTIAMDADGDFVVVWESDSADDDTSNASIQGQRFHSNGDTLGTQFQVNTYTTSVQEKPTVAMAQDGAFVVVWQSFGSDNGDNNNFGIQAQRYSPSGDPVASQFLVNTYTNFAQRNPSVDIDADGDFVVAWRSYGSNTGDTSLASVQAQRFTSDGSPIGDSFLVNTSTLGNQEAPSVAVGAAGDFVVAWQGNPTPSPTGYSVYGQRFRVTADIGDRVFQDVDSDGRQTVADVGVSGISVHLRDSLGDLLDSTTTDADGAFLFQPKIAVDGVADQFYLEFDSGLFATFTTADIGGDDNADSDADALGETPTFTISSAGESRLDVDAGLISTTPVIGDRVWYDTNSNDVQDQTEPGVAGVTVRLLDSEGNVLLFTTTNSNGLFSFSGVGSGSYRLEIVVPGGLELAAQNVGSTPVTDSDFDPVTAQTDLFAYTEGTVLREIDAGLQPPSLFADGFESGDTSAWSGTN